MVLLTVVPLWNEGDQLTHYNELHVFECGPMGYGQGIKEYKGVMGRSDLLDSSVYYKLSGVVRSDYLKYKGSSDSMHCRA